VEILTENWNQFATLILQGYEMIKDTVPEVATPERW